VKGVSDGTLFYGGNMQGMNFGEQKYPINHGITKARVTRKENEDGETELTAQKMLESGLNENENLDEGRFNNGI